MFPSRVSGQHRLLARREALGGVRVEGRGPSRRERPTARPPGQPPSANDGDGAGAAAAAV